MSTPKIKGRTVLRIPPSGRITDLGRLERTGGKIRRKAWITAAPYLFLCVLTAVSCWLFVGRQGMFGVKVDWLSQHSVFPDYFRQQFYETGRLFPEFAGNIGGGQNIYHFAYYGLYSPIFLLSYLLPFVKMGDYLMAVSAAGILASVCLLYYWLGRKGFSWEIRLPVSVLFLLAGPVIFQSCHQVMFISYMPFLLISLLGVDKYFEKSRSGLYICGVFLMIMTSFYYSIGGMLALAVYGLARYMELRESSVLGNKWKYGTGRNKRRKGIWRFLSDAVRFLLPMVTAVLMSGFLLAPAAFGIFGNRDGGRIAEAGELFMPKLPLEGLVHSAYGIGLTTGIITVLIAGLFYQQRSQILLHGLCLLIFILPVFQWLLNGGLYVRGKALIPFLPLACYLTAVYLKKQKDREISFGVNILAYLLTIAWLFVSRFHGKELAGETCWWYLMLAESVVFLAAFCIYWKRGNLLFLTMPPVVCLLLGGSFFYSHAGGAMDAAAYNYVTDEKIGEVIGRALAGEEGFFRMEQSGNEEDKSANLNRVWNSRQWISSLYSSAYNPGYQSFRSQVFGVEGAFRNVLMQTASDNPLYQKLMGIKYVVGKPGEERKFAAAGYECCLREGRYAVYQSEHTAPVAYATDKVMDGKTYDSLEFPYNQLALTDYAVVPVSRSLETDLKEDFRGLIFPAKLTIPEEETGGLKAEELADGAYRIHASEKTSLICGIRTDGQEDLPAGKKLSAAAEIKASAGMKAVEAIHVETGEGMREGKLLFVRFQVKNCRPNQDVSIWLNGTRNKLSAKNHIYYNGNTVFTYVMPIEAKTSEVRLDFGKGDYEIADMECYLGDAALLEDAAEPEEKLYQSPLQIDWEATKGNCIRGKIQVQNAGYVVTSIPYDTGFEIRIDGKQTAIEKVNKAFLGCSIGKGEHELEITYHAPGAAAGKGIAFLGILIFILILGTEAYKHRHKE